MVQARFARNLAACSFIACLLVTTRTVAAQTPNAPADRPSDRVSLFATAGYNSQTDDESRLGKGIAFSGGVGYSLTRRLSIEASVARFEHRRDLQYYAVTFDAEGRPVATPYPARLTGSATYLLGQARYVFSTSRVRPYVVGAFGLMRYSGNGWGAVLPPDPGQPSRAVPGVAVTSAAFGGGGGLDVTASKRVALGPYFGLLLSNTGETGTKYLLHGGVRLTVGM